MNNDKELVTQNDLLSIISDFISKSKGLKSEAKQDQILISQKSDAKKIFIKRLDLTDVLVRKDAEGKDFVQINFNSGKKLLLTDQLIGFRPHPISDLDLGKLPKVVTTADLISVFEAIEESISVTGFSTEEVDTLRKVFQAILQGGEDIGLDLSNEKSWLRRLSMAPSRRTAS